MARGGSYVVAIPISSLRQTQLSPDSIGAGEGIRTLDPNLGKVVLYP
jgi:hypothetical protein